MKIIQNNSIEIKDGKGQVKEGKIVDLIFNVIDYSQMGKVTTSEQIKRIRLYEEIERQQDNETIELEDADFNHLKLLTQEMIWAFSTKDVRNFCNQIINLK